MCVSVSSPPDHAHVCAKVGTPEGQGACLLGSLLPEETAPLAGPGHSSRCTPARSPTHRDSWSPLRPARASCHPSSSPKGSCSRKPSRWVAQGSPRRHSRGAQVLGRGGLSPAAGAASLGPAPTSWSLRSPPEPAPLASRSPLSSSSPLPSALPDSLKAAVARLAAEGSTVGGTVSSGLLVALGMLAVVRGCNEGLGVGRMWGVLPGARGRALGGVASLR